MNEYLNRMQEKLPDREAIVEVGSAVAPMYWRSEEVKQKIKAGAKYVGIGIDEDNLQKINREEVGKAVAADLAKLPFRDGSVNEMWLCNVFGNLQIVPERLPDGGTVYVLGARRFFDEMVRVLREDGTIYIGEFSFPARDVSNLAESDFSRLGLDKMLYRGKAFEEFLRDHRMRTGFESLSPESRAFLESPDPFFLVLTKRHQSGVA